MPTEDHYVLAGIFKSSLTLNGESQKYVSTWNRVPLPTSDEHREQVKRHAASLKSLAAEIKKAEGSSQVVRENNEATQLTLVQITERELETLKVQLAELQSNAPKPVPEAMAPTDRPSDEIADSPVHIRDELKNLGKLVPRGFLRVCSAGDASIRDPQGSGRIELADWLTDPDNPLVARVFVNRVWMHLMGEGLVRTVDNFGLQGERPTHPELLDTLAVEFVRGGWHLKPLIRDLKRRGLWDETLLVWGGAFGRPPVVQGKNGRDHNPQGFSIVLSGGCVKPGFAYGETDDYGYYALHDRVHMHDLHATILHLLGIDHERLTYRYAGRDFRLTDVHARVVHEVLA